MVYRYSTVAIDFWQLSVCIDLDASCDFELFGIWKCGISGKYVAGNDRIPRGICRSYLGDSSEEEEGDKGLTSTSEFRERYKSLM